ncbi:LytTR family DNA-binding domain-containing protein [Mangrovivirga sp. M17]|uniref:LytTR family DNA-binding domain-containing protein n=1 Tax=Mangrovivirga halotolerans TaxID=2993936 RepID=A0ABT3RUY1_9BACT|nr:LytTR family DNA-binding domain-containing protein [Mangrovivirga halotolerans]MCX2745440.1 LytTR family DNA-binding domain-containing protein [Mangrovivirga halotolerans]
MKGILNSLTSVNFFSLPENQTKNKRILYWLTITVTLFAFLEFSQDFIESFLNNSHFSIIQSLSYKLFWFVFIPFIFLFLRLQNKYQLNKSRKKVLLTIPLLIIVITLFHLLVFSLLLYFISFTVYDKPWPLTLLLTQKLSTRLYLGLSFYIIFSFIYYYFDQKVIKNEDQKSNLKTFPIKCGSKTTLLDTQKIYWIVSDGPYLEVNTPENKHVILGSLKNIIKSLPGNFSRIHKSTIVNTDQIVSSKSRGNGDYDLVLKCGKTVRLSRNYAKPLKDILH